MDRLAIFMGARRESHHLPVFSGSFAIAWHTPWHTQSQAVEVLVIIAVEVDRHVLKLANQEGHLAFGP